MKKAYFLILVLILTVAVITGCGDTKTINTDKGSVSVNEKENKLEVKTEDGNTSQIAVDQDGEGVSLPEGYPKDLVPIMDDAKIQMSNKNENADKKVSYWVGYFTAKAPKDTYKFYQDALKDLQDATNSEINGMYMIGGVKGDSRVAITITTDDGDSKPQTMVNINIEPNK